MTRADLTIRVAYAVHVATIVFSLFGCVILFTPLVTGLLGFSFAPFLGSIAAVITGHIALHQIKRTQEQGSDLMPTFRWNFNHLSKAKPRM